MLVAKRAVFRSYTSFLDASGRYTIFSPKYIMLAAQATSSKISGKPLAILSFVLLELD
jgi:hypothetical protein